MLNLCLIYIPPYMKITCSINGRAVAKYDAKISIFDNSLFYADGLFETLLALNGDVIFLDDHLDRLEKGAKLINLTLPVDRSTCARWIRKTNLRNSARIKKVRLTVTAGDSGFWAGRPSKPRIMVIATEYQLPSEPFRLMVAPFRVDQDSPFRNVKTLSFIIEMTARKHAYQGKFDDAILINRAGFVAESTSANLFWIKDGVVCTSPLTSGCLEGMTRKHILELAAFAGMRTCEKNIRLKDLLKTDEIFVSSSLKIIIPVTSVTDRKTHRFPIGPVTKYLQELLYQRIGLNRYGAPRD
ncbi:MAG: aminotransferase class IV family protein [candidate division Zixibacteria bacterium]|nr:aminotransferase class IV family protein [candidate division Zixibacteria bacterium]